MTEKTYINGLRDAIEVRILYTKGLFTLSNGLFALEILQTFDATHSDLT